MRIPSQIGLVDVLTFRIIQCILLSFSFFFCSSLFVAFLFYTIKETEWVFKINRFTSRYHIHRFIAYITVKVSCYSLQIQRLLPYFGDAKFLHHLLISILEEDKNSELPISNIDRLVTKAVHRDDSVRDWWPLSKFIDAVSYVIWRIGATQIAQ